MTSMTNEAVVVIFSGSKKKYADWSCLTRSKIAWERTRIVRGSLNVANTWAISCSLLIKITSFGFR